MGRLLRILLLAFFIMAVSAGPLLAKPGKGHGWGGGNGGGRGGGGGCGVPEIDPSLAPSALALLAGGVLILKSKPARK